MNFCTSFLLKPSSAMILACSGQMTMIASGPEGPSIFCAKLISTPSAFELSRSDARIDASALIAVTVLSSALKPRSTWSGSQGLASSFSPTQMEYFPGHPSVALQVEPGYEPPILRFTNCTKRPMVALARQPSPRALEPPLTFSCLAHRPVDDDHHRRPAGGGLQGVEIQLGIGDRFHRGDQRRHVLRLAAGHDSVDGDFFHRRMRPARRHRADDFIRFALGRREHLRDPRFRGRDDRQAIGPALSLRRRLAPPKCHPVFRLVPLLMLPLP